MWQGRPRPCSKAGAALPYPFLDWIKDNMDDYVGAYCTHWYVYGRRTDDKGGFTTPATCGVRPNGNSAWLWAIVSYYLPAR